jgi:hypothetical protein
VYWRGRRAAAVLRKMPRSGEYRCRRERKQRRRRVLVDWFGGGEHGEKRQRKKKEWRVKRAKYPAPLFIPEG